MKASSLLLRLTFAGLSVWAPVAVAQAPAKLVVQLRDGIIRLSMFGEVGQSYCIESATTLGEPTAWIPFDYLKLPRSPYLFYTNRSLLNTAQRFYRTRESNVLPVADMVYIPEGSFTMGSPLKEVERFSDETQHQVTLTRAFWMGKHEVTQGEYVDVIGSNPSYFRNGTAPYLGNGGAVTNELRHPVEQVSWEDATNYCGKLTAREFGVGNIPAGWRYHLPTEAEWEYACRGGTTSAFHQGAALLEGMADFNIGYEYDSTAGTTATGKTYLGRTSDVESYVPNAYGLYDMHGDVWEWCQDWYGAYPSGSVTDPVGPNTGTHHVFRGGGWNYIGRHARSANRFSDFPTYAIYFVGFRVVLAPGQ